MISDTLTSKFTEMLGEEKSFTIFLSTEHIPHLYTRERRALNMNIQRWFNDGGIYWRDGGGAKSNLPSILGGFIYILTWDTRGRKYFLTCSNPLCNIEVRALSGIEISDVDVVREYSDNFKDDNEREQCEEQYGYNM